MENLTEVELKPTESSNYVKPLSMFYKLDNVPLQWDFLIVHNAVAVIIYNTSRNVLVLVKQFRPPLYINSIPEQDRTASIDTTKYPAKLGLALECCAGTVDKPLTLAEIAAEEVFEECGYKVEPSKLEKVASYRSGVGITGATYTTFYCEVTDDMKVSKGGGVHGEIIEVVEMSIPEVKEYLSRDMISSPPDFCFAMYWFFNKMKL